MGLPITKFSYWNWRDVYRFPMALVLVPFVLRNFRLRMQRRLPDRAYWADQIVFGWGYCINSDWI